MLEQDPSLNHLPQELHLMQVRQQSQPHNHPMLLPLRHQLLQPPRLLNLNKLLQPSMSMSRPLKPSLVSVHSSQAPQAHKLLLQLQINYPHNLNPQASPQQLFQMEDK